MTQYFLIAKNAICLLGLCLLVSALEAQTAGSFLGTVNDPSGAVIAGANVTATNTGTGLRRSAQTNALGQYVIPLLPPGTYNIEGEAAGFQAQKLTGMVLLVNEPTRADLKLGLSARQETVSVSAQQSGVETVTAALNRVIDEKDVKNLPLNGRNFLQLATLVPGSVPGILLTQNFTPTTAGTSSLSVPQVNGLRSQSNNILLDGVDDNELFLGEASAVPSPDAIQEFSVQTSLYGAEFGRGAGSIVNAVTKSGTDSFHGSLYEYLRNDVLDAQNYFAIEKPPLERNQFGAALGGPILKGKTHFFGNFEGLRLSEGVTQTASVPTKLEKQGNFSASAVKPINPATGQPYPNDTIPSFDPVAANLLQFYPDPIGSGTLTSSSPVAPTNENEFLVRIDHQISQSDSLMGNYFRQAGNATTPFATTFLGAVDVPSFPVKNNWTFEHVVLTETHVFSARSVNEFRFGLHRDALLGLAPGIPRNATDYGFTFPSTTPIDLPQWAVAGLTVNGYTDMGPGNKATNVFQWIDIYTHTAGRHAIKVGADIRRNQLNSNIASAFNGAYSFSGTVTGNAFADFLIGRPTFFEQSGGNADMHFRASDFDFFGEDTISLSARLKLTLGLRYERPTWPYDLGDHVAAFRPGEQSTVRPLAPIGLVYPGDVGVPRSTIPARTKNFAPRIGLAWDPTGSGRTSVRAGYGIFYDSIPWHNFDQLQIAPPFSFFPYVSLPTSGLADPYAGTGPFLPGLLEVPFSAIPEPFQFNVFDQNAKTPYAQQYNLSIQHSLSSWTLETAYVGTTGIHLPNTLDLNQAVFVPGQSTPTNIESRRPFGPNFASIDAQATVWTSSYNSMQLSAIKRAAHGLSVMASYTWSKSIDTISTPQAFRGAVGQQGGPMNNYDISLDRGPSAFDATNRFVGSYSWDLPNLRSQNAFVNAAASGWSLLGIYSIQTGLPFTILDPTDPSNDGNTNDRANLVGNPNLSNKSVHEWFNTSAFVRVVNGAGYGDAGRNDVRGPRLNDMDFSVVKRTPVKELATIEYRAEFFNIFNHPSFIAPVSDITSPNFGQINSTRQDSNRQIQMVLRVDF